MAIFVFEYVTEGKKGKNFHELKEALFKGYSEYMPLSEEDINLVPYFLLARKLSVIAWIELQKYNSRLRKYYPDALTRAINFFRALDTGSL